MAEDGDSKCRRASPYHQPHQDTFRRAQEAQAKHEFPVTPTGIVRLPPGSRGPRSLYIKRHGDSFGFRLRHFIVYPPDSITEDDGRHAAVGALLAPMDTIFVWSVADGSPAKLAGLHHGDRIISVNGIPVADLDYAEVVQLIQNSPGYLHLLVVPKEEDVLQQYFADTAYNPVSNKASFTECLPGDPRRFVTPQTRLQPGFQVDAASWNSLRNPYDRKRFSFERQPEPIYSYPQEIYAEPQTYDFVKRARAQPQVPIYKKMGRRASEGSTLSDREYQQYSLTDMVVGSPKMKPLSKSAYAPEGATQSLPPQFEVGRMGGGGVGSGEERRESSSSLTSSLADGSKDSLSSFDSASTLTGLETDDSVIMSRIRKSFQQKEEFLRRSSNAVETPSIQQREFYGRPKKLEKAMWPPSEHESPSRTTKPQNQNVQRLKNENTDQQQPQPFFVDVQCNSPPQLKLPKNSCLPPSSNQIQEAATAPPSLDHIEKMNGSASEMENSEDQRLYPPTFQMVSKRAREFESGKPLPEDDPILRDRTSYYRSELAKLSSKKLEPNVQDRTRDYETLTSEFRRDDRTAGACVPSGSATLNRTHRDSRSMESQGSNASSNSLSGLRLSGNVLISSGSKYIHCPPPSESKETSEVTLDNRPMKMRERSNSADSWATARQDSTDEKPATDVKIKDLPSIVAFEVDPSPVIPVPVERMSATKPNVRPTQLDLNCPKRPERHLKVPQMDSMGERRSTSPVGRDDNKPVVVRRPKNTNLADEERATRRESYLKATEGGRVHFEHDILADEDVSPQVLRSSGSASGGSNSSLSLDREKCTASPALADTTKSTTVWKEGLLHCKIAELDGKRAADRSWKQVWAMLVGTKLFLCKDNRHHLSPTDTSEASEPALSSGVDMRSSVVRVAENYTKRKHVFRVSSIHPCRSEFLLQAENAGELADWVKILQSQVVENDMKTDLSSLQKQQAVPQTTPTQTTIQVQGSNRLSPQPSKSKSSTSRNRSPTGQSPVSKTRKPSAHQITEPCTSPKSKTWRGRMAKQFRRIHQGANSPSSPTAPEGSTFGVPIDQCIPSENNQYVPKFVEICTKIVDDRGLGVVGIYRVPGNNASVTALTEEVNRNYETVPQDDPRWNDVHVVSSLLKSFFRKMPESLVTNALYPNFIEADKIDDARSRMIELKKLIHCLPPHNYHTLKHVVLHLKNVVQNSEVNKMEAKNLAIVFGPTIVRVEEESMQTMVNNMTHQCKIVETLLLSAEWFFCEENLNPPLPLVPETAVEDATESSNNQALLLDNICKFEALKDQKEKNETLFSSIIMAAQRKVKKKSSKSSHTNTESKEEITTPNGLKEFPYQPYSPNDLKPITSTNDKTNVIPTTVADLEKSEKPAEKVPWFNYSTDKEEFHRRVENFELETKAMLQMPRKSEISVNSLGAPLTSSLNSSSSSVQNTTTTRSLSSNQPRESYALTKTHSASNVFTRISNTNAAVGNARNSLNVIDGPYGDYNQSGTRFNGSYDDNSNEKRSDANFNEVRSLDRQFMSRRGSSAENINSGYVDVNANGSLKKVKYENELDVLSQKTSSLDSLNKLQVNLDDGPDLLTTMTKLYDEKLKNENVTPSLLLEDTDFPYVDDSPERINAKTKQSNKENLPQSELYRNPSLHKSKISDGKKSKEAKKTTFDIEEKDRDSSVCEETVPDNERHIKLTNLVNSAKLRRSESLNKPERNMSPLNVKLKRSESLNKTVDKLTKTEKTESNISKKRELVASKQRSKRKNGMPDRSIKRRHTVGGTKDPDKVNWLDNKYQEEVKTAKEGDKEKSLRTSSPDLSWSRKERLLLEVNVDMVMALRQHLVGARPQSFPESGVFKVPLESHV